MVASQPEEVMTVPMDASRTMSRRGLLSVMAGMAGAAVSGRLGRADRVMAAGAGLEGPVASQTSTLATAAAAPGPAAEQGAALLFSAVDSDRYERTVSVGPEGIRAHRSGHWSRQTVTIDGTVRASGGGADAASVGPMIVGEGDTMGVFGAARVEGPGVKGRGPVGVEGEGSTGVSARGESGPGISATGWRGGTFAGNVAQLQLQPSELAIHPALGEPGDLFVDASRRLWFCKGGSSWVQVA